MASLLLPPESSSPRRARKWVTGKLIALPTDVVETTVLLTSELVSNAVVHARTVIEVTIWPPVRVIRVGVADQDSRFPVLRRVPRFSSSGRGLVVVAELADYWGVERRGAGKIVWFEMEVRSRGAGGDDEPV